MRSSRPLDKGGGGGRGSLPKIFFQPFGAQSGLKIREGGRPSTGSSTERVTIVVFKNL